jgi:hypothetical protein
VVKDLIDMAASVFAVMAQMDDTEWVEAVEEMCSEVEAGHDHREAVEVPIEDLLKEDRDVVERIAVGGGFGALELVVEVVVGTDTFQEDSCMVACQRVKEGPNCSHVVPGIDMGLELVVGDQVPFVVENSYKRFA